MVGGDGRDVEIDGVQGRKVVVNTGASERIGIEKHGKNMGRYSAPKLEKSALIRCLLGSGTSSSNKPLSLEFEYPREKKEPRLNRRVEQ